MPPRITHALYLMLLVPLLLVGTPVGAEAGLPVFKRKLIEALDNIAGGRMQTRLEAQQAPHEKTMSPQARYFRLTDNVHIAGRWYVKSPLDDYGEYIIPWQFLQGKILGWEKPLVLPLQRPGRALDFTQTGLNFVVVNGCFVPSVSGWASKTKSSSSRRRWKDTPSPILSSTPFASSGALMRLDAKSSHIGDPRTVSPKG